MKTKKSPLTPGTLPGQAADPELAAGLRQVREGDFEGAVVTLDAVARRLAAGSLPGCRAVRTISMNGQ